MRQERNRSLNGLPSSRSDRNMFGITSRTDVETPMTHTIPPAESLIVEFKSDRSRLGDDQLIDAIVGFANAQGGELWLGVEDDGTPTGLHADHMRLDGMAGLVASRTSPSVTVSVSAIEVSGTTVARIFVRPSVGEVCTKSGKYLQRRLKSDGTPENAPMLPHERSSRAASFGEMDVSAHPVANSTLDDFDPLEIERLRQSIRRYGGDEKLLELDDEALEGALGFFRVHEGTRTPTLTGILLVGREESLRRLVPTHELAFQVLDREAVEFNEFQRFPLLKALNWLETNFRPYNREREVQVDLFRVPVPLVDMNAFREAVANALVHRDYHRRGAVHVRLEDDALAVSNPGGLVDGVTLANLLTTEPRPRNPCLADAMKRIGLVERSGRGVDTIYRGMLRFGRPEPAYEVTDSSVALRMSTVDPDMAFLKLIIDEEARTNRTLPIDSLITLASLKDAKRLSVEDIAKRIHRDPARAKRTLEALVEAGLVEAHGGTPRTRSYMLAARLYHVTGKRAEFTRQVGFSSIQHEQMALNFVKQHGRIRRSDVIELCRITPEQARLLLKKLRDEDALIQHGVRRGAFYTLGEAG